MASVNTARTRWTPSAMRGDPVTWGAVALWCCCALLLAVTALLPPVPVASAASDAAPCTVGQVKGSVNHLYHVQGGRWYAQTRHAVCFARVADARAAGYREAGG